MCLIIKENQEPEIATEDIICYKLVEQHLKNNHYRSFFQYMPIRLGTSYKSIINKSNDEIYEAFHSYILLKTALMYTNPVRPGFKAAIIKCIIPKGSVYYSGRACSMGESYASDTIIYTKKIINPNK